MPQICEQIGKKTVPLFLANGKKARRSESLRRGLELFLEPCRVKLTETFRDKICGDEEIRMYSEVLLGCQKRELEVFWHV